MSKVSFSRELLGTIRFIFDKTKSRTLNATQAYDISTSQIVLGSFPATASKKTLAKSLLPADLIKDGGVVVSLTANGALDRRADLGKADREATRVISANVSFGADQYDAALKKSKIEVAGAVQASTSGFTGTSGISVAPGSTDSKSNAAKDIFYGAITVGTGLYREWQGKYAVLKVDLLTNNAILRVYNE